MNKDVPEPPRRRLGGGGEHLGVAPGTEPERPSDRRPAGRCGRRADDAEQDVADRSRPDHYLARYSLSAAWPASVGTSTGPRAGLSAQGSGLGVRRHAIGINHRRPSSS